VLAEEHGFDAVWAVEHHFDDYAMCPDNLQLMAYLAARTSRIKLGLGAVILPWNDPLRVVEKVSVLEILAPSRVPELRHGR
jgi:alkanesulfonate monooxygenase SsuD/methylene tetrahydromethanopterin reductase-like flavin-dependent oxidoreductase (luciferase family)